MWKSRGPVAAALALAALPVPSLAETPEKQTFTLTNTADRVAFCTVLVDGRTHVQLALRAGKSWSDALDPRRPVQLVCNRAKQTVFGPLATGKTYRLLMNGRWWDLAEGAAE